MEYIFLHLVEIYGKCIGKISSPIRHMMGLALPKVGETNPKTDSLSLR